MKFSINQEKLSRGLQIVTRAVPTKASLPILNNILINANEDSINLSSTNLETAIKITIDAVVKEKGTVAVPARVLKDFISSLNNETLDFAITKNKLVLKTTNSTTKFNGIDPQDYPELPKVSKPDNTNKISSDTLEKINKHVTFSASNDVTKGVFTGIFLKFEDENLISACTDGNRLSEYITKLKEKSQNNFDVVIPAKTFAEVTKIFSDIEDLIDIFINQNDNLVIFKSNNIIVATRILDGNYPDYKRVIPSEFSLTANISLAELDDALKKTNIFAKENDGSTVKIKFDPVEKQLVVSSQAEVSGENRSIVAADIDGDLLEAAFNSRYLLDFCNNYKIENILIKTNSATSPFLISSDDDKNFVHLIMPLQTFN